MGLGPVFGHGGGAMWRMTAGVTGYPYAAVKDLHGSGGGAYFHLLPDQLVGHAIPVVIKLDVVIDIDAMGFPVAILIAFRGQRPQRWSVEQFE